MGLPLVEGFHVKIVLHANVAKVARVLTNK